MVAEKGSHSSLIINIGRFLRPQLFPLVVPIGSTLPRPVMRSSAKNVTAKRRIKSAARPGNNGNPCTIVAAARLTPKLEMLIGVFRDDDASRLCELACAVVN